MICQLKYLLPMIRMIRAISRLSQHQGLLAQAAVGAIYKPDVLNVVTKQALPALSRSFAAVIT